VHHAVPGHLILGGRQDTPGLKEAGGPAVLGFDDALKQLRADVFHDVLSIDRARLLQALPTAGSLTREFSRKSQDFYL
jgi:hypothetical protein